MWNDALPRNGITNWKTYYAVQGTDTATGWQTWMKPAGCSWIYILMLAAGGGGGKSSDGTLTVAAGGGGSGGHTRMLIPAFVVPDILYVRPGAGGLGSTTAAQGAAGVTSYVAMQPNTTAANLVVSQAAGQGGFGVAGSTGGTAGVGGITTPPIISLGLFTTVSGATGGAGATATNGTGSGITVTNTVVTTSGAGGGNGTGAGGNIINALVFPTIPGGVSTGGIKSGGNGFQLGAVWTPGLKSFPMIWSGGAGGAGRDTNGTAGDGGNASYGGGGGGGGSGATAGTVAGNGGNGGDAIIFIGAF